MAVVYYLIRTPTLEAIADAIEQKKTIADFPTLHITEDKDLHFIYRQTLVDIADIVRNTQGTTAEISVLELAQRVLALGGSIYPSKLSTPVIRLETDGESTNTSNYTPAILGKAILGRTILGKVAVLPKLSTPNIYLEIDGESMKLDAPVIYIETGLEKLDAPTINLVIIEDGGEDEPIIPIKLGTPVIYLHTEAETIKLSTPTIYLETVDEVCEHTYTNVVTDATCTEQGYTTYTCTTCGDVFVSNYTDALGHSFGEPYYSDEFATGYGHKCERCGHCEDLENPIEQLEQPHIWLEEVEDEVPDVPDEPVKLATPVIVLEEVDDVLVKLDAPTINLETVVKAPIISIDGDILSWEEPEADVVRQTIWANDSIVHSMVTPEIFPDCNINLAIVLAAEGCESGEYRIRMKAVTTSGDVSAESNTVYYTYTAN